jgi:hypothetical protein
MDDSAWCALDEGRNFLKSKDLRWTFQVDNLTMLSLNDENAWGMEKDFQFGLGETTML